MRQTVSPSLVCTTRDPYKTPTVQQRCQSLASIGTTAGWGSNNTDNKAKEGLQLNRATIARQLTQQPLPPPQHVATRQQTSQINNTVLPHLGVCVNRQGVVPSAKRPCWCRNQSVSCAAACWPTAVTCSPKICSCSSQAASVICTTLLLSNQVTPADNWMSGHADFRQPWSSVPPYYLATKSPRQTVGCQHVL